MFRLIRFLLTWGFVAGLIWVILQLDYKGKPVKVWAETFVKSPLLKEAYRQGKGLVADFWTKGAKGRKGRRPPMDLVSEEERRALERVLELEQETEK